MRFEYPMIMDGRPTMWVPGDVMEEVRDEGEFPQGVFRWAAGSYLTGFDGGDVKESVHVVGDWIRGELEDFSFKLGDLQVDPALHYLFVLARPNWPNDFVPWFPCYVYMAGYRPSTEALPNNIVKFLQPAENLRKLLYR